jgi:hypothetical protein
MNQELLQDLKDVLKKHNATIEFEVDAENLWGPQPRIRVLVPDNSRRKTRGEKVILELHRWSLDSTDINL